MGLKNWPLKLKLKVHSKNALKIGVKYRLKDHLRLTFKVNF